MTLNQESLASEGLTPMQVRVLLDDIARLRVRDDSVVAASVVASREPPPESEPVLKPVPAAINQSLGVTTEELKTGVVELAGAAAIGADT